MTRDEVNNLAEGTMIVFKVKGFARVVAFFHKDNWTYNRDAYFYGSYLYNSIDIFKPTATDLKVSINKENARHQSAIDKLNAGYALAIGGK